jgi:hypothetical protein
MNGRKRRIKDKAFHALLLPFMGEMSHRDSGGGIGLYSVITIHQKIKINQLNFYYYEIYINLGEVRLLCKSQSIHWERFRTYKAASLSKAIHASWGDG